MLWYHFKPQVTIKHVFHNFLAACFLIVENLYIIWPTLFKFQSMKDWKYVSKHNITKTFKHRNVALTELNHVCAVNDVGLWLYCVLCSGHDMLIFFSLCCCIQVLTREQHFRTKNKWCGRYCLYVISMLLNCVVPFVGKVAQGCVVEILCIC